MDRGAWGAAVHGAAESDTPGRLSTAQVDVQPASEYLTFFKVSYFFVNCLPTLATALPTFKHHTVRFRVLTLSLTK